MISSFIVSKINMSLQNGDTGVYLFSLFIMEKERLL